MSCGDWSADGAEVAKTVSIIHHGGVTILRTLSPVLFRSHLNTPGNSSCRKSMGNGFAPIGTFTWKGWPVDPCETDIGKSQTTTREGERYESECIAKKGSWNRAFEDRGSIQAVSIRLERQRGAQAGHAGHPRSRRTLPRLSCEVGRS